MKLKDEAMQLERGRDHKFHGETGSELLLSETRPRGYSNHGAKHFLEQDLSYAYAVMYQSLFSFLPYC